MDIDLKLLAALKRDSILSGVDLSRFMAESNAIEGETGLNPNDIEAAKRFLSKPMTEKTLLECHGTLAEPRRVDWGGRYRDCHVRVGDYLAPEPEEVPRLMRSFFRALPKLDSWHAHNRFQKIHPFRDLNGRTGRLIWLHRAIDEGYTGRIGFLHAYYYATLRNMPKDKTLGVSA